MGKTLLNSKGQSTVEYILLLVVVASLAFTVFQSDAFKEFFGENSSFFATVKKRVQFTYRHGLEGEKEEDNFSYNDGRNHFTYFNEEEGTTRFFLPLEGYGVE